MSPDPPPIYAATCRKRQAGRKTKLDTWALPLVVGQSLPPLYIWLTETLVVSLDLEAAYGTNLPRSANRLSRFRKLLAELGAKAGPDAKQRDRSPRPAAESHGRPAR